MDVLLKPELEKFVAAKVKAGQFADVSDVVNEALEVLRDQEEFTPEHEAYLRQEVKRGIDELSAGATAEFDAHKIIADERQRMARRRGND